MGRRITDWRGYKRPSPQGFGFKEWLRCVSKAGENPEGDFIRDARADDDLPNAKTLEDLQSYVRRSPGSCREAVEASAEVWQRYVKWRNYRMSR